MRKSMASAALPAPPGGGKTAGRMVLVPIEEELLRGAVTAAARPNGVSMVLVPIEAELAARALAAGAAHPQDRDQIAAFLAACTLAAIGAAVPARALYEAYRAWCTARGMDVMTVCLFGRLMASQRLGDGSMVTRHKYGVMLYGGLQLKRAAAARAQTAALPITRARRRLEG